jgi:hypothetical protein
MTTYELTATYGTELHVISTIDITVTSICTGSVLDPVTDYKMVFAVPELGYGWLTIVEP